VIFRNKKKGQRPLEYMTDEYLYDGIGLFYRFIQWLLSRHKLKRAKRLKKVLCVLEPKHRDIPRYLAVIDAIKFWTKSKEW
jgi:hypothetical protein